MNFLFWNVGQKPIDDTLVTMITETSSNIIALAEYSGKSLALAKSLHKLGQNYYPIPTIACERITVLSNLNPKCFRVIRESDRYVFFEFKHPGHVTLLLCFVHLASKLYFSDNDQQLDATALREDLESVEKSIACENTLIVGDFNMNPFEMGMTSAKAMHAIPCLRTATHQPARSISGRQHSLFYNPCWNLLGDNDGIPGTYFRTSATYNNVFWSVLDQVILRPGIASRFDRQSLKIIDTVGRERLTNHLGRPSLSDHLPLRFTLLTEQGSENDLT